VLVKNGVRTLPKSHPATQNPNTGVRGPPYEDQLSVPASQNLETGIRIPPSRAVVPFPDPLRRPEMQHMCTNTPPLRFNDRIHSPMIAKTLFEHPLRAIPAGKNSKREFEQRIPQPIIATRGIETTPRRFNDQIVPARISKRGFEQCILQPIMATRGIEQLIPQPVITKRGFESPRGDHLAAQACPSHLVTGVHAHLCAD
jgi:hypothetical protein